MIEFCGGPGSWQTRSYAAARNGGATCNGKPIQVGPRLGRRCRGGAVALLALFPPTTPHPPCILPRALDRQVSATHDVRKSLLVTGFGYEHDECWLANMRLFQHYTDVAQGVRRLGSAAIDMCHVASGAPRGGRVVVGDGRGSLSGQVYLRGQRTFSAQLVRHAPLSAPQSLMPPHHGCCCPSRRHVGRILGVSSQALGHGGGGSGGGGGGRHRDHHGWARLFGCVGGITAVVLAWCRALPPAHPAPLTPSHPSLLAVFDRSVVVSNGFLHKQLLQTMEPATSGLLQEGIDLSQWFVPEGYSVHSGPQLD